MKKLKLLILAVALTTTCLASSCRNNSRQAVRVGYLRLLSATPLYTAIHEGYFADEGIDIDFRVIKSGPEGNEALAAGNIDVAFSILPSLVVAKDRGVPSDLVAIYGASIDGPDIKDHRIIVPQGSNIRRADDLHGKKIAVVGWPGMTSDVLELLDYLERNNLSSKDVTLVGMAHGDMVANLQSGLVEAAAVAEPYITIGILQGAVKTLEEDEGFYYKVETEVTSYLARRAWVEANPELTQKFLRALDRGRQKSDDREWLINKGLPSFNNKATPPIDFVELTPEQSKQLRLMPIHALPSENGLKHVSEQLVKRAAISKAPNNLNELILPMREAGK